MKHSFHKIIIPFLIVFCLLTITVCRKGAGIKYSSPNGDIKSLISYDFSPFLRKYKGALLFFSSNTQRFYGMVGNEPDRNRIEFFRNRRYRIYFVPDDIKRKMIKSTTKTIGNKNDIESALTLLEPTSMDGVFTRFEECFKRFEETGNYTSRNMVTRKIAMSNGYFLLLLHLGKIKKNEKYNKLFKEILGNTIELYKESESPFKAIDLIQADIPGFSKHLKEKYLRLGDQKKIPFIIQILTNPINNLSELIHYLDGNFLEVSGKNLLYFKRLSTSD